MKLAWIACVLASGCCCPLVPSPDGSTTGSRYWKNGCITADGTKVVAVGHGLVWLDTATGAVVRSADGDHDRVVCPAGGDAIGLTEPVNTLFGPARATWLTGGAIAPRPHAWRVHGLRPDGSLVSSARTFAGSPSRARPAGALLLAIETLGQGARLVSSLPLEPAALAGVGEGPIDLLDYRLGRPLADGTMMVAAGYRPTLGGQFADGRARALFRVDIAARRIERASQSSLGADDQACVFGRLSTITVQQTSPDGALHVAACGRAPSIEVVGIRVADATRAFASTLPDAREPTLVSFDRAGGVVAIGTQSAGGQRGVVRALDARTGATSWTTPMMRGSPIMADAMPDGSWIVTSSKCEAMRIDGTTGAVRWNVTVPGC